MCPSLGQRHPLAHPPPRPEEVAHFIHHAAEPLRRDKVVEAQGRRVALLDAAMILLDVIGRTGNRLIEPETVIKTVCGRDAAVELIGTYSQRVWIIVSGSMCSTSGPSTSAIARG